MWLRRIGDVTGPDPGELVDTANISRLIKPFVDAAKCVEWTSSGQRTIVSVRGTVDVADSKTMDNRHYPSFRGQVTDRYRASPQLRRHRDRITATRRHLSENRRDRSWLSAAVLQH